MYARASLAQASLEGGTQTGTLVALQERELGCGMCVGTEGRNKVKHLGLGTAQVGEPVA